MLPLRNPQRHNRPGGEGGSAPPGGGQPRRGSRRGGFPLGHSVLYRSQAPDHIIAQLRKFLLLCPHFRYLVVVSPIVSPSRVSAFSLF